MIKISKRLASIASYVEDDASLIDIGCDHGLLDIYLYQAKKNIKIIASDVNQNALNNAVKNIKKYKLQDKIKTTLSNGLDNINTKDIDTIVISGMGSHTITGILYSNLNKLKNIQTLILQSNNDLDFLRYKITKIGYYIENETLVKDQGIIYTVIKFKRGHRFYTKKQLFFGPCLILENSPLFQEKNHQELKKLKQFYPHIPKNHFHHRLNTYIKIQRYQKITQSK